MTGIETETEEEAVYADWSALRTVVPAVLGLIVACAAGLAIYLAFRPAPELASLPVDEAEQALPAETDLGGDDPQTAEEALAAFLSGLEQSRFEGLSFAFSEPSQVQQEFEAIGADLGPYRIETRPGPVEVIDSANAKAPVVLDWELDDGTSFSTEGEVDLVLVGTDWQVDWEPSIVEASLDPGDTLVWERVLAPRAPILGRDGVPLVDNRPVFNIGVIPRQVDDIAALSAALGQLLGEDPSEIQGKIAPSPSDSTVPIATRRVDDLAGIQAQLSGLPGVVLEASTFPLAPNERFGRALLGRSAEVTREILDESPELFLVGDIAGRSGLQRQYNERLHGVPGYQVRVERRFPSSAPAPVETTTTTAEGQDPDGDAPEPLPPVDPDVVFLSAPVAGTPLNLTIDQRVQTAAENALAATELVSALVAVEVSTGHILALANGPGAAVNNFALTGQYPPGSVFKAITAYAAMENGYGLTDPVDCPLTLNVNGREFTNAEGEVLGTVPMRRAFVLSCNTAFINLAAVIDPSDFPNTAARFGIGAGYSLGTASFSGNVPTPGGPVEKAATSFGQSQILISPLSGAVMAATAAGGTYRPPVLVIEPDAEPVADQPIDPTLAANLREIMRAVVTNGTGRAVAGVAGGPVSGKTGTAEFGNQNPPQAHAWFVGFQGDIAFAVFVEGGEFGGATAAPIAGSFLNQLAN